MECYVIKVGGVVIEGTEIPLYVKDVPRPITQGYYGKDIETTQYDDEAKHYKTEKLALGWVRKNLNKAKDQLEEYIKLDNEAKENDPQKYTRYQPYTHSIGILKSLVNKLSNAKVLPVEVEVPNFSKKFSIRYDQYRERQGTAGKGLTKLCFRTDGRYSCKCCGIKLKKIPYYDFYEGNNTKICIPCLYIRQEAITSAFESMDEEFRTELHNELMIRSL